MSLLDFVRLTDVVEKLKPLRQPVRSTNYKLKVEPSIVDPRRTGTAFDYLLRFELQRRAAHATDGEWVAEHAKHWFPFEAVAGQRTGPTLLSTKAADPPPN